MRGFEEFLYKDLSTVETRRAWIIRPTITSTTIVLLLDVVLVVRLLAFLCTNTSTSIVQLPLVVVALTFPRSEPHYRAHGRLGRLRTPPS